MYTENWDDSILAKYWNIKEGNFLTASIASRFYKSILFVKFVNFFPIFQYCKIPFCPIFNIISRDLLKVSILFPLQLKEEILSSYQQIKTLCSQLRQRTRRNSNDSLETSSSSEEIVHPDSLKSGSLTSAMHELKGLVHDLLRKEAKGACLACGADTNEKIRMEVKIHKTQEENEKLERRLKEVEDLGKRKDDEILDVKSKVTIVCVRKK